MLQIERHQKIVEFINEMKKVTTDQLAQELNVSKPTIRRDIDTLDKNGLIRKVHGGAVSMLDDSLYEIPYATKITVNISEKQKIGATASRFIQSGDVIILDSGSTTLELAKNLSAPNVTVITNDIKIALELSSKDNVQTIVCGGLLLNPVYTLTGNSTLEFIRKLHVNKVFLGCDALDLSFGMSDRSYETAAVKQAMIEASDHVYMLADNSKFNKKVFYHVCDTRAIHTLITDSASNEFISKLNRNGTEVIISDAPSLQNELLSLI